MSCSAEYYPLWFHSPLTVPFIFVFPLYPVRSYHLCTFVGFFKSSWHKTAPFFYVLSMDFFQAINYRIYFFHTEFSYYHKSITSNNGWFFSFDYQDWLENISLFSYLNGSLFSAGTVCSLQQLSREWEQNLCLISEGKRKKEFPSWFNVFPMFSMFTIQQRGKSYKFFRNTCCPRVVAFIISIKAIYLSE